MKPSTPPTRALALLILAALAVLTIMSLTENVKSLTSTSLARRTEATRKYHQRNWETELGPFTGPPDGMNEHMDDEASVKEDRPEQVKTSQTGNTGDDNLGIPMPIPIATPLSIVACWFGHSCSSTTPVPGDPIQLGGPPATVAVSAGGIFGSVLSILAGSPTATPASGTPGESTGPLGGLLSALSQAAPSPGITAPPTAPTGSGSGTGGLGGLSILGGVASALDGVLGGSDGTNHGGSGLLGQLSANIIGPLVSIAADPAAILANPTAAINNLQSQVSAVLNGMPSAMAAGMQLASNVGGDLAEALNATSDLLDSAPDVAGDVANQVGSLLNAGPALATGLPAAAIAAVDKVGGILNEIPGLGNAVTGLLAGMQNDLSDAAANAGPQISAMAAVVGSQVAGVLPSGLQSLVAAAVASQQTATQAPTTQAGQLGALLSSLSSSMATAAPTSTDSPVDSVAESALSGLSSLMGIVSQLSLSAASTPPAVPVTTRSSPNVAQTTIYHVQTITALITSTAVQTIVLTFCPSSFASYAPLAYPGLGSSDSGVPRGSSGPSEPSTDGSKAGPCPGQGYTCSDCLNGWFCPPAQTPAAQVPCGYGWPCYHCQGGWFCVPGPQVAAVPAPAPLPVHAHSTSKLEAAIATSHPAIDGYQYVGCYQDNPERALRDAQLLDVAGGMTSGQCVDFCQTQGYVIAGTEDGTQCFCGTLLLDSVALGNDQCDVNCAGDAAKSTMCGGSWALSIWTADGSIQLAKSPKRDLISTNAPSWQNIDGVKTRYNATTAIYAYPPELTSPAMEPASLASMNMSSLESAILAVAAAEVSGMAFEPASVSGVIENVSMKFNMGNSSTTHDLSLILPTNNVDLAGAKDTHVERSSVITSTTSATIAHGFISVTAAAGMFTSYVGTADPSSAGPAVNAWAVSGDGDSEGMTTAAASGGGSYVFPTPPIITRLGITRGRRAPRRWASWD